MRRNISNRSKPEVSAGSPLALLARSGLDAVLVIDAWHESHLPLARRYLELCQRHALDCRLSESRPAELCEAECGEGCAAVARQRGAEGGEVRRADIPAGKALAGAEGAVAGAVRLQAVPPAEAPLQGPAVGP